MERGTNLTQPEYLYRYRPLGHALAHVLAEVSGEIWFSRPENLNDPFDGVAFARSRVGYTYHEPQPSEEAKEVGLYNKRGWMIACWTENWDSPPMWSHYAANYSGVCFSYKKSALENEIRQLNLGEDSPEVPTTVSEPVVEGGPSVVISGNNRGSVNAHKAILDRINYLPTMPTARPKGHEGVFLKQEAWGYEREWRIAVENTTRLKFPGRIYKFSGSLNEILVGYNADQAAVEQICRLRDVCCPDVEVKRVQINSERNAHVKSVWRDESDMTPPSWMAR